MASHSQSNHIDTSMAEVSNIHERILSRDSTPEQSPDRSLIIPQQADTVIMAILCCQNSLGP